MDSPEALKNKGYETFGEHFFNAGAEQERKKFEAEKQKMAEYFRSRGVPEDVISGGFAIKWAYSFITNKILNIFLQRTLQYYNKIIYICPKLFNIQSDLAWRWSP